MTSGITYQSLSNLISNFDFCSDMNISQDQNLSFFIEYNSLESTFSFFFTVQFLLISRYYKIAPLQHSILILRCYEKKN